MKKVNLEKQVAEANTVITDMTDYQITSLYDHLLKKGFTSIKYNYEYLVDGRWFVPWNKGPYYSKAIKQLVNHLMSGFGGVTEQESGIAKKEAELQEMKEANNRLMSANNNEVTDSMVSNLKKDQKLSLWHRAFFMSEVKRNESFVASWKELVVHAQTKKINEKHAVIERKKKNLIAMEGKLLALIDLIKEHK
jgi:hypothetical protein